MENEDQYAKYQISTAKQIEIALFKNVYMRWIRSNLLRYRKSNIYFCYLSMHIKPENH